MGVSIPEAGDRLRPQGGRRGHLLRSSRPVVQSKKKNDLHRNQLLTFFTFISAEMKAVRLSGGLDRCSGKVEIHRNGSWGTVCDYCWNERLASMVCSMLGCGSSVKFSQFNPPLAHNDGTKWYYMCRPGVPDLWHCGELKGSDNPFACQGSKASGVICNGGWKCLH